MGSTEGFPALLKTMWEEEGKVSNRFQAAGKRDEKSDFRKEEGKVFEGAGCEM